MLKPIDNFLNKITMYRLTLYFLAILVQVAIVLSFFKLVPYSPIDIALSTMIVLGVCAAANYLFAKLFGAVTNIESVFITALILVLIVPARLPLNLAFLIGASILAMASKYLLTVEKRHLLNPAAVAVVAVALLSNSTATWWVGTPAMFPFVVIGGFLLVRKIQRERLVLAFLGAYFAFITISTLIHNPSLSSLIEIWQLSLLHSALIFFAVIMLTEPLTSPPTKKLQTYYAAIVAFLYATLQLRLFNISLTPEMALCLGNIFSFAVSPKYRLQLPLKWTKQLSPDTYMFGFQRDPQFTFTPGQYLEWTLPHDKPDNRGNRRYFSLASSPAESELMMLIKFYDPPSTYKRALLAMQPGQEIIGAGLAGDFVLPKALSTKLCFIAGGVGIAPFRSMVQHLIDQKIHVDITIFYANKTEADITCADVLEAARPHGVKTIYVLTDMKNIPPNWTGRTGHLTAEIVKQDLPDYASRIFYLSGPQNMVQSFETILYLIVPKNRVKVDFFPGY